MGDVKILVVDDEPRMRKLVKDFLVKDGFIVIEAEDGEDAYNKFISSNDISLIIMDVMMPKMNGYETSAEIRKISKVPIIMLTAKSEEKGTSCRAMRLELTNISQSHSVRRFLLQGLKRFSDDQIMILTIIL